MTDTQRLIKALRECTCHEDYTNRQLEDPTCQFHSGLHEEAADLIEQLAVQKDLLTIEVRALMRAIRQLQVVLENYQTIAPN